VRGSLIEQDVDAIVNAANGAMRGGGGIDGVIHRAAGRELLQELIKVAPHGSRTGEVIVTGGHNLPYRYIIHVPGPIWRGGIYQEEELLTRCYRNSLLKADELGVKSLAFCSISTGVYNFPMEKAAPIAVRTVRQNLPQTNLERVVFAMFGEEEHRVFSRVLSEQP